MEYEIEASMPRLEFSAPSCSHCGTDVQMDDGVAWCEPCRVQWDRIEDGAASRPDPDAEGSDVPCEIKPQPIDSGTGWSLFRGPCILPSGHEGDHVCPMSRVPDHTDGDS